MKILIASHAFFPMTGGIETMTALLAEDFTRQGHSVRVVTQTPSNAPDKFPYAVFRQPKRRDLLALVKWSDIYFHNNICLQMAWPLLLLRRPWVVVHQTWIGGTTGQKLNRSERLKQFALRFATGISISQAIADHVSTPSVIIGNAYRDDVFYEMPEIPRKIELVFLGRLVSDKGADILIEALGLLKRQALTPRLTIIGIGPEREALERSAHALGVAEQICFTGQQTGGELARTLNSHQILVVPSRWREPFGIVALEGIACGCVVVGSEAGGMKDAIGPCGVTFPNGDATALANVLFALLSFPENSSVFHDAGPAHLNKFQKERVAAAYLEVFTQTIQ